MPASETRTKEAWKEKTKVFPVTTAALGTVTPKPGKRRRGNAGDPSAPGEPRKPLAEHRG